MREDFWPFVSACAVVVCSCLLIGAYAVKRTWFTDQKVDYGTYEAAGMADMEMVRQPTQVKWILFCFSDRNLFWTVSHIGVPGGAARRSGGGLSWRTRPTGDEAKRKSVCLEGSQPVPGEPSQPIPLKNSAAWLWTFGCFANCSLSQLFHPCVTTHSMFDLSPLPRLWTDCEFLYQLFLRLKF